jgi:hypothetical protein
MSFPLLETILGGTLPGALLGGAFGFANAKYGADMNAREMRANREWQGAKMEEDRRERERMAERQRLENEKDREAQMRRLRFSSAVTPGSSDRYENPFWQIVAAAARR